MYRIAVCDDDMEMRGFLRRTVEGSGISCTVEEFSDGMDLLRQDTVETRFVTRSQQRS